MQRQNPYFGITGFMNADEVRRILAVELPPGRKIMIGVLTSFKKLNSGIAVFPGRYPEPNEIKTIFINHPKAVNLIHYACGKEQATLPEQLEKLFDLGGQNLDGFQLNVPWPNPAFLEKSAKRATRIVLQLGGRALQEGGTPENISQRLNDYQGLITDVLIDASGGHGKPLDVHFVQRHAEVLIPKHPEIIVGFAGGLSPETIELAKPLLKIWPEMRTDAEGGVRDKPADTLNVGRAIELIQLQRDIIS